MILNNRIGGYLGINGWENFRKFVELSSVAVVSPSLCKQEAEDAFHFIFSCSSLKSRRDTTLLNECKGNTKEDRLGVLLYEVEDLENVKRLLHRLWQYRHHLLKSL